MSLLCVSRIISGVFKCRVSNEADISGASGAVRVVGVAAIQHHLGVVDE
jgi:hypothetical protein